MMGESPGMFCPASFFFVPPPCMSSQVDRFMICVPPRLPPLAMAAARRARPRAEARPFALGISPLFCLRGKIVSHVHFFGISFAHFLTVSLSQKSNSKSLPIFPSRKGYGRRRAIYIGGREKYYFFSYGK